MRTNSWSQQTDAQIDELDTLPGRLLTYSADSEFRRVEASLALGYCRWGTLALRSEPRRSGDQPARGRLRLQPADPARRPRSPPDVPSDQRGGRSRSFGRLPAPSIRPTPSVLLGAVDAVSGSHSVPKRRLQLRRPALGRQRDRDGHVLRSGSSIRLQAPVPGRRGRGDGGGSFRARARRRLLDRELELRFSPNRADSPRSSSTTVWAARPSSPGSRSIPSRPKRTPSSTSPLAGSTP